MQISSNSSSLTTPFPSPRANATVGGSPPAEALPTKIKQVSDIPADPQSQRKLESSEPAWLNGPMTEAADAVPRWLAAARTRSGSETDSEVARKAGSLLSRPGSPDPLTSSRCRAAVASGCPY